MYSSSLKPTNKDISRGKLLQSLLPSSVIGIEASHQPPFAVQATWEVISRRKTSLDLFQIFGTLTERLRERKRTWTHQLHTILVLHAMGSRKPNTNRHHSRPSRSEQCAAIGKVVPSTPEPFQLTSRLFFIRKTSNFSHHQNCTKFNLSHNN